MQCLVTGILDQVEERDQIQMKRHLLDVKRILAPTDLTLGGRKAVEYALALAEHFNAQLTLLNVYDIPTTVDEIGVFECLVEACRQNAQTALDKFSEEIKIEYPNIDNVVRCGVPGEEITSVAKDLDVDLIVISTHNYNWFRHLIQGSGAEQVLRNAPCPILIVRKEEHDFVTTN